MTVPAAADLAAVPLFAALSPEELSAATQLFAVRVYPKDAIVATEGEPVSVLNFILSGRVKVFWRHEAGRQVDVAVLASGEHFADSTFGGETMLHSVIAVDDLRLASIRMTEFEQLLLRHPKLAVAYLKRVVARLRRVLLGMRAFTMEDVYGRVVDHLLTRAVEMDGKLITERLTHAEIGHRVGATREMVGRVLRELARGGYIKVDRGRITVLRNPPRRW